MGTVSMMNHQPPCTSIDYVIQYNDYCTYMSNTRQYGANGFIPTVNGIRYEGNTLVLETISGERESDIIGREGEPLVRLADLIEE